MRKTECKPCVNTQLNRLVENTQRQQHDGTHEAKYGRLHHSIPPSLTSTYPFLHSTATPISAKKNIGFLMQILICSHDGVQDQVVDPVQFQTTWAIYRNEVYFLSKTRRISSNTWQIHSIPCDFTNSSSSKKKNISLLPSNFFMVNTNHPPFTLKCLPFPLHPFPFQKQHPYPTRWFTKWQWAGSKSASHTRNLSAFSSTSWQPIDEWMWCWCPSCPPLFWQDSSQKKQSQL